MPVVPGFRSEWHKFVYDTIVIAAGAATGALQQFFVTQIGQGTSPTAGAGSKQIQDTNLLQPQLLPFVAGDMWVKSVRLVITGSTGLATPNDVFRLFKNFIFTLFVNNDEYLQCPLDCLPAGGGPQYQGQLSTAMLALTTTSLGAQNGLPSASAALMLDKPIGIGQGETFRSELNGTTFTADAAGGTTLGNGLIIRTILEGWVGEAATQ
jgi:hypothetical protein